MVEAKQKFEEKYRAVLRISDDGTVKIIEDVNGNYVLEVNEEVEGVYEHKQHAYRMFGIKTRERSS